MDLEEKILAREYKMVPAQEYAYLKVMEKNALALREVVRSGWRCMNGLLSYRNGKAEQEAREWVKRARELITGKQDA